MISQSAIFFLVPSLILGSIGSLYLKKGAKKFRLNLLALIKNFNLIIGVFLSVISIFLYIYSLKYSNLSRLFPLVSLNYILIAGLSAIFLKEKLTLTKVIGIIFITFGCFLTIK